MKVKSRVERSSAESSKNVEVLGTRDRGLKQKSLSQLFAQFLPFPLYLLSLTLTLFPPSTLSFLSFGDFVACLCLTHYCFISHLPFVSGP